MQIYQVIIECHLIYAISAWGSTFQTYSDKLISYQSKAVKTIAKATWNDSPSSLYLVYSELDVLKVATSYELEDAKITQHIDTKKHHLLLGKYFEKSGLSHSYSTRTASSSQLHTHLFLNIHQITKIFPLPRRKNLEFYTLQHKTIILS